MREGYIIGCSCKFYSFILRMEIKIIWASIFSEQNFFAKFRVEA